MHVGSGFRHESNADSARNQADCRLDLSGLLLDTDVANELGPDSLEQIKIVMGLEKEFGLDLGDNSLEFGDVCDIVSRIQKVLADRESL